MSKLIISGKKAYTKRMYKHLRKEHPSTRTRMKLQDKMITDKTTHIVHHEFIDYCELCGKKMSKRRVDVRKTNMCNSCLQRQLEGLGYR